MSNKSDYGDVLVFDNNANESSITLELAERVNERSNINVEFVSFFEPTKTSFDIPIHSVNGKSKYDFFALSKLLGLINEKNPDILHIHPYITGSLVRVITKIQNSGDIISTEHGLHTDYHPIKNVLNGTTNWMNNLIICNSNTTCERFYNWENKLLKNTRKTVIYNGVDINRLDSANRTPLNLPEGYLVGTVGRLEPEKNIQSLLEGVSKVNMGQKDMYLIVIGSGSKKEALQNKANSLGIYDRTLFLGHLARESVYSILKDLDLFIFPSNTEGFGVALAEAMAAGTPVIANQIQTINEVLGDAGIIIDMCDSSLLSEKINEVYNNPIKGQELGQKARQRVQNKFEMNMIADEYANIYSEIIQ